MWAKGPRGQDSCTLVGVGQQGGDCQHSGGGTAGEDNTRGGGQERDLRDAINFMSMKPNS